MCQLAEFWHDSWPHFDTTVGRILTRQLAEFRSAVWLNFIRPFGWINIYLVGNFCKNTDIPVINQLSPAWINTVKSQEPINRWLRLNTKLLLNCLYGWTCATISSLRMSSTIRSRTTKSCWHLDTTNKTTRCLKIASGRFCLTSQIQQYTAFKR